MNHFQLAHNLVVKAGTRLHQPVTDATEALFDAVCRSKNCRFEESLSDSPFVESIWQTQLESLDPFIFPAVSQWGLVVTKLNGKTILTVRGPGTKATLAHCPGDAEFFGIIFKQGVFMPHLPPGALRDRTVVVLPEATSTSFWLNGSAWQYPTYENVETFVDRVVHDGMLVRDEIVDAVLQNQFIDVSLRSIQRRFKHATGLTHSIILQMERARFAKVLLQQGTSIMDTMDQAGYYDQSHLTRSLKRFIGRTPAQIAQSSQLK